MPIGGHASENGVFVCNIFYVPVRKFAHIDACVRVFNADLLCNRGNGICIVTGDYFHIVTRAKDGAGWKNLNSSFNNIAKYCKKIYFMFDIARIYWYNYICGKSKGVTGRKYLFVLFFAQGRQMNAAAGQRMLKLESFFDTFGPIARAEYKKREWVI